MDPRAAGSLALPLTSALFRWFQESGAKESLGQSHPSRGPDQSLGASLD